MIFNVESQHFPSSFSGTFRAMVSVQAPLYKPSNRAPLDLVAVLDRSGSMSGAKMELVKRSMELVVKQLNSNDKLSIVAFDTSVSTLLPLISMDQAGKQRASEAIQAVHAGGGTNLCDGLMQGISQLRERVAQSKNDVASIFLFTDGLTNAGITNKDVSRDRSSSQEKFKKVSR
jgi:Mg-chelatase subunit ChlD